MKPNNNPGESSRGKSAWRSFQGCVTATGPLIISALFGFALYRLMQPDVEPGLARWAAVIIALCVLLLISTLIRELENKQ